MVKLKGVKTLPDGWICVRLSRYLRGFVGVFLGLLLVPLSYFEAGRGLSGSFGVRREAICFVLCGMFWGRVCCGFGRQDLALSDVVLF